MVGSRGFGVFSSGVSNAITGSGTANKVAKFTDATVVGDSSITDDGSNVTMTIPVIWNKLGTAAGTATQKNSEKARFQMSLWDGAAEDIQYWDVEAIASTTVDQESRLAFTVNGVEKGAFYSNSFGVGTGATAPSALVHFISGAGVDPLRIDTDGQNDMFTVQDSGVIMFQGVDFLWADHVNDSISMGETAANLTTVTGAGTTAYGTRALQLLSSGAGNTGIGTYAGNKVTTSGFNTFIGYNTGGSLTTGSGGNTFIGYGAGTLVTTGTQNTFIGRATGGASSSSGTGNTLIGYEVGSSMSGASNYNLMIGSGNGFDSPSTYSNTLLLGTNIRISQSNIAILGGPATVDHYDDVYIGTTPTPQSVTNVVQNTITWRVGTSYNNSGIDENGHNLVIAAGLANGDGTADGNLPASLSFQTTDVTASGSTLNGLTTRMHIAGGTGYIGIGAVATAAFLHIKAGTTAASQLNLASSTAPSSPNDGDFWFDGTDLFIRVSGVTYTLTKV